MKKVLVAVIIAVGIIGVFSQDVINAQSQRTKCFWDELAVEPDCYRTETAQGCIDNVC